LTLKIKKKPARANLRGASARRGWGGEHGGAGESRGGGAGEEGR